MNGELSPDQPVRLRLSPLGYLVAIVAGVLLLTMVGLLIAQVVILKDSQRHIQAQDHKIATLQGDANQVGRDAKPAIDAAVPVLRRAARLVGPARVALDAVPSLGENVRRIVMGADLVLSEAIPLLDELRHTRLITRASDAIPRFEGLIAAIVDIQRQTLAVQRETLTTQRRTLRTQRRTFRLFQRSVQIQQETLERTRSIDRKTGPTPPQTPVTPAAPSP
jgi:hypothetical protein